MLKNLVQFFADPLFQIFFPFSNIKKEYLQILKNLTPFFAYPIFQILKKEYLKISKYLFHIRKNIFACLFNIHTNNNFKGNNLNKNNYTNNSRKHHYTN